MKYFCSGRFVFWGDPRDEEHWITRKLSLGRHYRRWREVERLRGCEGVPLMWKVKVETYRKFSSSTGTIPALFVGSRWMDEQCPLRAFWQRVRNFREADCACDEWRQTGMMIFWKPGFKSGFGSWFSQSSKLHATHVTSDDKLEKLMPRDFWVKPSFW